MIIELISLYVGGACLFAGVIHGVDVTERECGDRGIPPSKIALVAAVWVPFLMAMTISIVTAKLMRRSSSYVARRMDRVDRDHEADRRRR